MATTSAQVQQLYVSLLGRAADQTGLNYWLNQLNTVPASLTLDQLRANIVNSQPEYAATYGGLSRADTVAKIYQNLFGHAGDAAGLTYWTTGGGSTVSIDQLQVAFVNGASTADAAIVANKVLVSDIYTSAAGTNFNVADATAILAGVNGTVASVTTAVGKLSDGSLTGVALPAGLATVKAAAVAEKAVTDFEAANVSTLTALQKSLTDLNTKAVADGTLATAATLVAITDTNANGSIDYSEAAVAITNATALRTAISTSTTATLQTNVTTANTALATAKANLVANGVTADKNVAAYNAAVAADAALKAPAAADITIAQASVQSDITTKPANFTADVAAYAKATSAAAAAAITDSVSLYAAIKGATTADAQAKLDAAFSTLNNYSNLKALALADAAKTAADAAVQKAITDPVNGVGTAYDTAATAATKAATILADAQAADALVTQATGIDTAHTGAITAANTAASNISTFAHDLDATVPVVVGDNTKADLFFFSAIKDADDFAITNFNKGDAIYVGEGYKLNASATLDSTGHIVGGDNNAKEVFFFKDATTGVVKAVIETSAIGSATATANLGNAAGDNVAVITLTGITNLSDVSFSNGVITSNHVAA